MRFKVLIISCLCVVSLTVSAQLSLSFPPDTLPAPVQQSIEQPEKNSALALHLDSLTETIRGDSTVLRFAHSLDSLTMTSADSLAYFTNPFFIPLIYMGKSIEIPFTPNCLTDIHPYYFGKKTAVPLATPPPVRFSDSTGLHSLQTIRNEARTYLITHAAELYAVNIWELPSAELYRSRRITPQRRDRLRVTNDNLNKLMARKMEHPYIKPMLWQKSLKLMLQFTQNYVSPNWYKGGTGSFAALTSVEGNLNFDNRKNIQWTNKLEWRAGIIAVADTTKLRDFNTSDDALKIDSKFALKAKGNWSYSAQMNFSTQFFDNFKAYNSNDLKAKFLTPLRLNFGLGMDYSYKKLFSLNIALAEYKLIYLNDTATIYTADNVAIKIQPNTFGIENGKNQLHDFGASLTAKLVEWKPFDGMTVNSTLKFYTSYLHKKIENLNSKMKVEVDWETVLNFTINRYLSTRLLINPRYDNTVILKGSEKARVQFMELLSFGFNYKL